MPLASNRKDLFIVHGSQKITHCCFDDQPIKSICRNSCQMKNTHQDQKDQDDDAMAKSEQLARDLQLAYELEAEQEYEANITRSLANGTNDVASNTNILGGGSGGRSFASAPSSGNSGSHRSNSPFSRVGSMFNTRNRNNSLLDDGSSSMQSNSSLLYVPCEINGRMVEMMVDSGSQTSVISSSMMQKLKLQNRLNTRYQVAAGVGAARILGRIDNCAVMVGAGIEFNLFFLVIDVSHDMMILGVDQVRYREFLTREGPLCLSLLTCQLIYAFLAATF